MKILIVGAGVIGGIYGWAFAEAGHDVSHLVREGRKQKLEAGLRMDVLDGRKGKPERSATIYSLNAVETLSPSDGYELVMVPTKHYQLGAALAQIADQTGDADYLIFTGNWRGTREVDTILPRSRYVWGDPIAGGGFQDETLVASLSPRVVLGEIDGGNSRRLEKLKTLFASAHINAEIPADIIHWHWLQYAINAGLLGALARAGSVENVRFDRGSIDQALFAVKEGLDVCIRRGVDLDQFPGPKSYYGVSALRRFLMALGLIYMINFNQSARRNIAHALNNPQEVEIFYCDVLNTGLELGIPMPHYASFEEDIRRFVEAKRAQMAAADHPAR